MGTSVCRRRFWVLRLGVAALFLLVPGGAALGQDIVKADPAHYKIEVENDLVRVVRFTLEPGGSEAMHGHPDRVNVNLTPLHALITSPDGAASERTGESGAVAFRPAEKHSAKNLSKEPLELVFVELKPFKAGAKAALQPETDFDRSIQSVVLENDRVRVLHNRYAPGQRLGTHTHPPRVAVLLTDADVREEPAEGEPRVIKGKRGLVVFSPATKHAIVNAGTAPLETIEIELKVAGPTR
jgi:quercetin dioxygenase-like cupin family protein